MNSKKPLYQAIADTLKERITSGQYKPGERIPAIRMITSQFGVNKATVHKAFERLKNEGLIENKVGSGSYVRFPEKIQTFAGRFDFRTDYLNELLFPYKKAQQIFNQLFVSEESSALAPTPARGDPELLQVLSQHYHVPSERMLVISGAQQGLDLVSKVFAAKISESILFEDPTYPGAISLFRARHFVRLNADGPDIDQLDMHLKGKFKLFYSMPSIHNPTGISYSREKKQAIVRRARQNRFYIIEDDYLGELKEDGPRFIDIDPDHTIHIKSFSQTTSAGIRLGFMVVPADLHDKFVYAKYSSDINSFGLLQKFLREFIKQGHYKRHIDNVRRLALSRRSMLEEVIEHYPFLMVEHNQNGYSLWVKSSRPISVPQSPWCRGGEFSFKPEFKNHFKLSFMNMDDETFVRGLSYLDDVIKRSA